MSYMNVDGSPDTLDQAILSARIMAVALGKLLRDRQSVVIELKEQKGCKDPHGFYAVQKVDGQIKTRPATPKEIESFTSYDKIMNAMVKSIAQ